MTNPALAGRGGSRPAGPVAPKVTRAARRQARDLDRATRRYLEPLLEPGEELLGSACASRAQPAGHILAAATAVTACTAGYLCLGSALPGLRYVIAFAGGASLSVAGRRLRERIWVGVTSSRVLCVAKSGLRRPALLLDGPASALQPAAMFRRARSGSVATWDLPGGRTLSLHGGRGLGDLIGLLTGQDETGLAD
jgi:hypothetical protein